MTRLVFLGTGGGRFSTIFQSRSTGGLYIEDGVRINIDPGPGTLLRMKMEKLDPTGTELLLVSHAHPDHYTDAEVMIEAMTKGGTMKRGTVIAARSVIEGTDEQQPAIAKFFLDKARTVKSVVPGDKVRVGHLKIEATKAEHTDQAAVGFKVYTRSGIISYVCDTQLFKELPALHKGARILILPVMRPMGSRIPYHLSTEDAAELVKDVKPELTIMTHFGLRMIKNDINKQVQWIRKETGGEIMAARDGLALQIGSTGGKVTEEIKRSRRRRSRGRNRRRSRQKVQPAAETKVERTDP